jgi:hypothetical protein
MATLPAVCTAFARAAVFCVTRQGERGELAGLFSSSLPRCRRTLTGAALVTATGLDRGARRAFQT